MSSLTFSRALFRINVHGFQCPDIVCALPLSARLVGSLKMLHLLLLLLLFTASGLYSVAVRQFGSEFERRNCDVHRRHRACSSVQQGQCREADDCVASAQMPRFLFFPNVPRWMCAFF